MTLRFRLPGVREDFCQRDGSATDSSKSQHQAGCGAVEGKRGVRKTVQQDRSDAGAWLPAYKSSGIFCAAKIGEDQLLQVAVAWTPSNMKIIIPFFCQRGGRIVP